MKANEDSRVKTKFTAMWTTVSQDAAERMLLLVDRIPLCQGAAFAPRHGFLGAGGRHLLFTWSDASCDYDTENRHKFRGWGGVAWLRGTSSVLVIQNGFTFNARTKLKDSTAVEYFAVNEMLWAFRHLISTLSPDIVHVQDSAASISIINLCAPKGRLERLLAQQRSQILHLLPKSIQTVGRHVHREFIPDCDFLTHNCIFQHGSPTPAYEEFYQLLANRMGFHPTVHLVQPETNTRQRINLLVIAAEHPDRIPPSLLTQRVYANPEPGL